MTSEGADTPDTGAEEPTPTPAEPPETPEAPEDTDWKAEAEKYKALSRKHEQRAKQNASAAKELEDLKVAQLSEQEKAVNAARQEGLTEGRAIANKHTIRAEVIVAAAGKAADPGDVYAILTANGTLNDLAVAEDGTVDTAAITSAIDELIKAKPHLAAVRSPSFGTRTPADASSGNTNADMDAWIRSGGR